MSQQNRPLKIPLNVNKRAHCSTSSMETNISASSSSTGIRHLSDFSALDNENPSKRPRFEAETETKSDEFQAFWDDQSDDFFETLIEGGAFNEIVPLSGISTKDPKPSDDTIPSGSSTSSDSVFTFKCTGSESSTRVKGTGSESSTRVKGAGSESSTGVRGTGSESSTGVRGKGSESSTRVRVTGSQSSARVKGTGSESSTRVTDISSRPSTESGFSFRPKQIKKSSNQSSETGLGSSQSLARSKSTTISSGSQALTTEWLRNQLDKANKECSQLRERVSEKDGENKLLRDKLKEADLEIQRQIKESEDARQTLEQGYVTEINSLKKELVASKTKIMLTCAEARSSRVDKIIESKKVLPEHPSSSPSGSAQSYRDFMADRERRAISFRTQVQKTLKTPIIPKPDDASTTPQTLSQTRNEAIPNILSLKVDKNLEHLGKQLTFLINPLIFDEARSEFSFLVPPSIDYYPFNILYRDVSEIPVEDNSNVQERLKAIWNIETWKSNKKFESATIKRKRYFTSINALYPTLNEMCRLPKWDKSSHLDLIIDHVTKMARELYIALWDPEVMSDTTINIRENKIIEALLDSHELKEDFRHFDSKKWKSEIYVDLRRGVALISVLADFDQTVGISVLQASGFLADSDEFALYRERRKPPNTTGEWYDDQPFLSREMKTMIKSVKMKKVRTIHTRDTFTSGNLEVGALTILFQKLTVNECGVWASKSEEFPQNQSAVEKYRRNKCFEDIMENLEIMKRSASPSSLRTQTVTPAPLPETDCSESVAGATGADQPQDLDTDSSEPRLQDYWKRVEQSFVHRRTQATSVCSNPSSSSLMDKLMEKEQVRWINQHLASLSLEPEGSSSTALERMSSSSCVSQLEREILKTSFHNFLKLKSMVTGVEYCCSCEASGSNEHGLFVPSEISQSEDKKGTKRRKLSLDEESHPVRISGKAHSSSSSSSSGGARSTDFKYPHKRYDLAPLRKSTTIQALPLIDIKETYSEVEDAVNAMFDQEQKEKCSASAGPPSVSEETLTSVQKERKEPSEEKEPDDKTTEERAAEFELLDILLEIVKRIGLLRFTINFNALFEVTVKLLQSCLNAEVPAALLQPDKVSTLVLEILYCRPSPIVLRSINKLFAQIMPIHGFPILICHNAQPNTFHAEGDRISFKRGACLLSTICTLTDYSASDDDWEIQFQMFRWLAYLMLVEKTVIENLYETQRTSSMRCQCIQTLNNTILSILSKSAAHYHKLYIENGLNPFNKIQLTEIIEHGVRMVSVIIEIDRYFAKNSYKQYESFILFLETANHMCNRNMLTLDDKDFKIIKQLLDEEIIAKKKKAEEQSGAGEPTQLSQMFSTVRCSVPQEMFLLKPLSETSKIFLGSDDEE